MEISPLNIIYLVLVSLIFGVFMGGFNDFQKFCRALVFYPDDEDVSSSKIKNKFLKRGSSLLLFVQDIVFFLLLGIGVVIINYYFNNGRFRIYAPVASILGFIVYYLTLGRVWDKIHNSIAFAIRRLIWFILSVILKPFSVLALFFGKIVKKFCKKVHKTIAKRQKKVYNNNKVKQILNKASVGFVGPALSSIRGKKDDRKKIL